MIYLYGDSNGNVALIYNYDTCSDVWRTVGSSFSSFAKMFILDGVGLKQTIFLQFFLSHTLFFANGSSWFHFCIAGWIKT